MLFRQLKPTEKTKPLFDSLRLNVDRLLRLINQLLLFREMENDALKLNLSEMKISDILNETYKAFSHFAEIKKIRFTINHGESINERSLFYDYDKVEKILANLISNALKNTPQKGEIKLVTCELSKMDALAAYKDLQSSEFPVSEEGYVEISVMDTGKGIEENELEYIFNRYRKSDNAETKTDYSGSGIGLDFTKRLVNLHKGDIIVKSKLNHGTTFSFVLPLDSTIYSGENKIEFVPDTQSIVVNHSEDFSESPVSPKVESGVGNFKIAVLEDNVELCDLIVEILEPNYNVISAYNGLDGLNLIEAEIPDLIISDITMPGMDGLTLCGKIKEDQLLNHIYLILLSAKSEARDQILGMEKGADMYINKPFNVDYLLAVVDAHFIRRERLNSDFKKGIAPQIEKGQENPEYLDFINKLHVILEQELNNETLNVQFLAERMNMSRSNYYRKFESVTGISPNSYMVKFRINKASEFMKESEYSVSDISYMVGFPNSAYFSTIFKKEKGVSPSQYIKDLYR
jgi:DNA-binding response OmpR family regulator